MRQHQQFLSTLLGANRRVAQLSNKRCFSTSLSQVAAQIDGLQRDERATAPVVLNIGGERRRGNVMSLSEFSRQKYEAAESRRQEESSYLAALRKASSEIGAFSPVNTESSTKHLTMIKEKINKIVAQEIEFLEFKDKHAADALSSKTYDEVVSKSNFYFGIDEQKKHTNLRLFNMNAPGNKYRKPSAIAPHEHVDPNNYIDVDGQDGEQMLEIYGWYSLMIDMHIAQIRPDNLDSVSYVPKRFNQDNDDRGDYISYQNQYFEWYHRWREQPNEYKSSVQIKHEERLNARPTTSHYDHDKGNKYEVEWRDDQKFPHVATRLGYPQLQEAPIERIFGYERSAAHPGYQFQPFVQTPSMDPDPTIDFRQGETIYENRRLLEWVRFWKTFTVTTFFAAPYFYLFETYAADGLPSLSWQSDNFGWWQIPQQFQDGGGWNLKDHRYCDDHEYMTMQYGAKRSLFRPIHAWYVACSAILLQYMNIDYVTRMIYNKDKDVVFVYKPQGIWQEGEFIYEMHHLEQMTPYMSTAIKDLSMQKDDGIVTVTCMATHQQNRLYQEDKYWNMDLKEEFMRNTRNLWRGNYSNARAGNLFTFEAPLTDMEKIQFAKVDREMDEAIKKHGFASNPKAYHEAFDEAIEKKKREIAASAL